MPIFRILLLLAAIMGFLGCGEPKADLPTTELTEEQKAAIKAEDAKVADEESHGAKKR
jgi:hypothetical protein